MPKNIQVKVINGNVEFALKLLKKKLMGEKLFSEIKRRQHFESAGERRRRKTRESKKRIKINGAIITKEVNMQKSTKLIRVNNDRSDNTDCINNSVGEILL